MKKSVAVFIIFLFLGGALFSQDLRPIGRDLSAFFEGIGKESIPYVQQNSLAGDGIGRAFLGEDSRFFFSFSLGVILSPGILTFIDEENSNFELLNVYGLVDQMLSLAGEQVSNIYTSLQSRFFFPNTRLALGLRLPLGIEIIGMFSIFPQAITSAIINIAGVGDVVGGVELSRMNAGGRIRKVLIQDVGGYPAISIGAGYQYSNFHAGFTLPEFKQEFAGSGYTLEMSGKITLDTNLHAAGLDFSLSKKLLIFYPFITIGSWYQWATYSGKIEPFDACFVDSSGKTIVSAEEQGIKPGSDLAINDLSVLLEGGVEIALGKFNIVPNASFNLVTKSFNLGLSLRAQF